jgi:putative addiction module component (TIGR02574 family)
MEDSYVTTKEKTLLKEALKLPQKKREALAEELFASLDLNIQPEVLDAIVAEAEKRWRAYRNGEIGARSPEDFFEVIRTSRKSRPSNRKSSKW